MAFTGAWGQWYEESEHPRGRGGQWVSKGGGAEPSTAGYTEFDLTNRPPENVKKLSKAETEAIKNYAGTGRSIDLNAKLRGQLGWSEDSTKPTLKLSAKQERTLAGLDSVMVRSTLGQDTVLYRIAGPEFRQTISALKPGSKVVDKAFISTSYTQPGSRYNVNYADMKILAPAGSHAIVVPQNLDFENEVILDRGSRLEYQGEDSDGIHVFKLQQGEVKDFSATRAAAAKVQQARQARAEQPSDEVQERYVLKDAPLPSQSIIVPKALLVQEHLTNVVDREVLVNPTEHQLLEISKEDSLGLVRLLVDKHNNVYAWDAGHIIHDTMTKALRKLGATGLPEITKDLGGAAPGVYEWDLTVKRPFAEPTYLGDERMTRHDVIEAGLAAAQKTREFPSDELTPAEEIVKQGGNPEYRRLDTPYLQKTVADYDAEAAKYPKEGKWIKESADKYRKELEWRQAVAQVRKEKPTSVGDITETFDVSREGLEEYSSPIQVGDIEYRIGQGVGYSPLEGGDYVMMDGLIVQGPRDRLAKPASDYPDVEAAIEKKYKESLTWQGGDFSKAQPTQYRHLVGKLLWGYKSPLTGPTYAAFMNKLAAGYFSNGQVIGDAKDNQIELAKKNLARDLKEGDAEHKEWVQKWYDREFKGVRMIQAMMREIRDAEWQSSMVSQEAVNQFAAFVKDTQAKLREAHPNEESLTLYRGVQGDYANELKRVLKKEEEAEIDVSPIDSWSTDESVARKFATRSGAVIKKQVPISEILFSHEGPRGSGLSSSDYLFGGQSEAEQLWGHRESRMRVSRSEVS